MRRAGLTPSKRSRCVWRRPMLARIPSARIVLLRGLDQRGLRFFTSYISRKGRELAENPHAAAVLYWPQLHAQVRIDGDVTPLGDDESDTYFNARPRGHRIAAWASEQSEPLESHAILEERFAHFDQRFEGEDVPRPHSWGGYLLAPARIEFWRRPPQPHARPHALHAFSQRLERDAPPTLISGSAKCPGANDRQGTFSTGR